MRTGLSIAVLAAALVAAPAAAQTPARGKPDADAAVGGRIVLDQPVRAAGLMLFPVVGEPKEYLYAPMTPRLARDESGRPQFSFLRWVQNTGPAASGETAAEGAGGGILHAVISLDVAAAELQRAQSELDRQRPGARIVGPAIYRSGNLALVSAFDDENDERVVNLVGLGAAPVLEGAKAAISLELDKTGAQILWESFQMPTPDISFRFDMKLPGFWSPSKGRIVADLDQVVRHETMQVAAATPVFEFELNQAFDELKESKAITVEVIGDVDADKEGMFRQAEAKIRDLLFETSKTAPTAPTPPAAGAAKGKSLLERAQKIQTDNRETRQKRKKAEVSAAEAKRLAAIADQKEREATAAAKRYEVAKTDAAKSAGTAASLDERIRTLKAQQGERDGAVTKAQGALDGAKQAAGTPPPDPAPLRAKQRQLEQAAQQAADRIAQLEAELKGLKAADPVNPKAVEAAEKKVAEAKQAKAKAEADAKTAAQQADAAEKAVEKAEQAKQQLAEREQQLAEAQEDRDALRSELLRAEQTAAFLKKEKESGPLADLEKAAGAAKKEADDARKKAEEAASAANTASELDSEEEQTEFVGYAAYELKQTHRTGRFEYSLDKYSNGELPIRFDENIGDLRRYLSDPHFFRSANLDDPLYKQREIEVYVDGVNSRDFDQFINFVTVQLRKEHESGDLTLQEVRIDRRNFNAEGNRFRMLYGWKGDDDRNRWLEYEWRAIWSFFGGHDVEEPWQRSIASGIRTVPPFQIRRVSLEADPDGMEQVRSTTVRLYYDLNGAEQVKQVTLRTSSPDDFSKPVEFLLPDGEYAYDYELSWRLRGNRSVSAPRATSREAILYVDELPDTE